MPEASTPGAPVRADALRASRPAWRFRIGDRGGSELYWFVGVFLISTGNPYCTCLRSTAKLSLIIQASILVLWLPDLRILGVFFRHVPCRCIASSDLPIYRSIYPPMHLSIRLLFYPPIYPSI